MRNKMFPNFYKINPSYLFFSFEVTVSSSFFDVYTLTRSIRERMTDKNISLEIAELAIYWNYLPSAS